MWHICGGVRFIRCCGGKTVIYMLLEGREVDGRIVLKWVFKMYNMGFDWICLYQEVNVCTRCILDSVNCIQLPYFLDVRPCYWLIGY